jgi:hypothetical protein
MDFLILCFREDLNEFKEQINAIFRNQQSHYCTSGTRRAIFLAGRHIKNPSFEILKAFVDIGDNNVVERAIRQTHLRQNTQAVHGKP